jgi:hypothetical protein
MSPWPTISHLTLFHGSPQTCIPHIVADKQNASASSHKYNASPSARIVPPSSKHGEREIERETEGEREVERNRGNQRK